MFLQNTGLEEPTPQEASTEDAHTKSPHISQFVQASASTF